MEFGAWDVRCHPVFADLVTTLYEHVEALRTKDPEGYRTHKQARFLARIYKIITEEIPDDPFHPRYHQGNTLGAKYREWKRAKVSPRHRLFFRYSSEKELIIDAWVNDDSTLRKAGSSTDVYKVFQRMLDSGSVENEIDDLEAASICPWTEQTQPIPVQLP